jgi:hypothetical protein
VSRTALILALGALATLLASCSATTRSGSALRGRAIDGRLIEARLLLPPPSALDQVELIRDSSNPTMIIWAQAPHFSRRAKIPLRPRGPNERDPLTGATWRSTPAGPEVCLPRKVGPHEFQADDDSIIVEIYDYCATLARTEVGRSPNNRLEPQRHG